MRIKKNNILRRLILIFQHIIFYSYITLLIQSLLDRENFILLGITANIPLYVLRSDNERGKWKRAVLISRPCSTMNESFIIPVPWFAEYRVNVTTDLWVKNGNGKEPRGGDPVHAMRACNYRGVRFFPAV